MKPVRLFIITALAAFGLLTLFMSSSVIFDLFNIRAHEGHYVLFIVWANFISGILFLIAAFAFFKGKFWAPIPLAVSLGVLCVAFVGLMIYVRAGGAYETKTIAAMIFRMIVNASLAFILYSATKKQQASTVARAGMIVLLSLAVLASGCGQRHTGEHHGIEIEGSDHHEGDMGAMTLNNGERWEADEHTRSLVADMKATLSEFEPAGSEGYQLLADSLSKQLSVLVAGCTMEGPAHDELHKWLVPVTHNIKGLAAAENATAAQDEVDKIEESIHAFDDFFE